MIFLSSVAAVKWRKAFVVVALTFLTSLVIGIKPDVYGFAAPAEKGIISQIVETPVHLSDDVMISLRSGYMLGQAGMPAYNTGDLAQASTSYLAPYVFFLLYEFLPGVLPVLAYAALGLICVALTMGVIALHAKFFFLGCATAALLTLTTTNAGFSVLGWDHLFQTFFLVWAASISLYEKFDAGADYMAALAAAAGVLYRPDGAIVAGAIVCLISYHAYRKNHIWQPYLLAFMAPVALMLAVNYVQFDHLVPTTARLKLGASPSMDYSANYFWKNSWERFSAGTLLFLFATITLGFWRRLDRSAWILLAATLATALVAVLNSDVFADARMLWMPACMAGLVMCHAVGEPARSDKEAIGRVAVASAASMACLALTIIFLGLGKRNNEEIKNGVRISLTAPQYRLMNWIEKNLNPADGAIGLYWLGMGYYINDFQVADFLGKADERIAETPVRWGFPGHNKWNIDITLEKWSPQVIVPTVPPDWSNGTEAYQAFAREKMQQKDPWAFVYDIFVNERVQERYVYCYTGISFGLEDRWGFYVRRDVLARQAGRLACI